MVCLFFFFDTHHTETEHDLVDTMCAVDHHGSGAAGEFSDLVQRV